MRRTQGDCRRSDHPALPAPPPSMSLQPSALSGVKHAPADLFEHTTRLRCSPPGTVDLCALPSRHTDTAIACADSLVRASAAHTVPFPSAASTPALLAPRVTVRVVHCIVQHEQALASGSHRCAHTRPHFAMLSALPLAAHQTRP
ncbi:hypothetical protein B0H14DRAFT_3869629 [Mycena olivaceomarginata]|nr:hypothetical protein B0H14DRAFT_3869629 [Mycena olivaceomarginata]